MERHPAGVAAARRRCADRPTVEVVEGIVPEDWPTGRFDLIVLSEVLYYLDGDAVDACLAHAHRSLVVGGHLVAVHYRRPVPAHRWTGDEIHDRLTGTAGWTELLQRHGCGLPARRGAAVLTPIEGVTVGIPARDEAALIEGCLWSVVRAARRIEVPVHVVVAADACSDDTGAHAIRVPSRRPASNG